MLKPRSQFLILIAANSHPDCRAIRGKVRGSREGLGLGLYICAEIAKAHGGTIDVTSDTEMTHFTLRMPSDAE